MSLTAKRWCVDVVSARQVKYLGGITFLLKDRCPEDAAADQVRRYEQCAANEILHVKSRVELCCNIRA